MSLNQPGIEEQTGSNAVEAVAALLGGEKPQEKPAVETKDESPDKPKIVNDKDPELEFEPESDDARAEQTDQPDPDGDEAETIQADESPEDEQPVTLKELSENLDVDVKELYDVSIPLGGGESITLGELKDGHKQAAEVLASKQEFETEKTHKTNELMIARREVEQLVRLGNQHGLITPQLLEKLEEIHVNNMTREHNSLVRAIPGWKDPVVRKTEFDQVVEVMSEWGFAEHEILNAPDHRQIKFMFDMTQRILKVRAAVLKRAGDTAKDIPSDTGRSKVRKIPKKGALKARIEAARLGSKSDQISLAAELIN